MPVKSGLVLTGDDRLEVICRPLSTSLTRCSWVIDDQTGPFDSRWIYESPENQALLARQFLDVPECRNSSTTCWRPRTLPKLAGHLIVDEWTYFFAIDAPEEEARQRAGRIARRIGDLSREFFADLDGLADLFLFHADGWWEFYTARPHWHDRLRNSFPGGSCCPATSSPRTRSCSGWTSVASGSPTPISASIRKPPWTSPPRTPSASPRC
jgi:hypothetical protein